MQVNDEIHVGEWCLVTLNAKLSAKLYIGLVLSFTYLLGTTQRTKEYSRSFASIKPPNSDDSSRKNPVGFLCTYFRYDNGILHEESLNASYVSLSNYKATIVAPFYKNDELIISNELLQKIVGFQGNQRKQN